ncbi:hypothetical protein IWW37_003306 [Coemansia sp. RSA 2050]|nr:hypothetical protein IWW37_003306 [Coemansia sp. RSA 2050]KAJ2733335.1 hypothetical protein IW152_003171 [Coemansia sp. BCRC 34962]
MSLFRNSSAQSTLTDSQFTRRSCNQGADTEADPTYYDVLKCQGEFSTPSPFFSRQLKPVHAGSSTYPWAVQPSLSAVGSAKDDAKHRLRRTTAPGNSDLASHGGSGASSSVFPQGNLDGSLPPSVFKLPTSNTSGTLRGERTSVASGPWTLTGMTSGGRALRKANQVKMSVFDRKVTLV